MGALLRAYLPRTAHVIKCIGTHWKARTESEDRLRWLNLNKRARERKRESERAVLITTPYRGGPGRRPRTMERHGVREQRKGERKEDKVLF